MTKFLSNLDYSTRADVELAYPGAIIEPAEGGFMIFATQDDYHTWLKQV